MPVIKEKEAAERKRKQDKKKKLKEKKKAAKAEELKASGLPTKGKGGKGAKGGAKGKVAVPGRTPGASTTKDDDEMEVIPEVLAGNDQPEDETFAAIMERFKYVEPENKEEADEDEEKPKRRTKPKASLLEEAEDSEDEEHDAGKMSKKKRRVQNRMSVAELKTLVKRPDVVEVWDTTASDPRLLVYLKAYRNTVAVPKHWSSKRKYMAGKRGVEKPPFRLPEFIEATGIAKIRQAIMEKQADMSFKQRSRERVHPKMGKLDIDYQVLHDAFFKFASKPKLSKHNDMYYEGKEYETKMLTKRPGHLSAALKEALGIHEGSPPPWLFNMQRYGPPPAYPNLKIPGLNAPIPQGAEYGYHPGGWGKPPVDEFGNPLYGDWKDQAPAPSGPEDHTLWGEVDDFEEEEDEEVEAERGDGTATPMLGTATPLVGSGSATPVVSHGVHSISGVSSITSGMDTPGTGTRSKKGGIASVSGISSASLTPTPQLFQVLEEQKSKSKKGVYPSAHTYKVGSRSGGGSSTPVGGVGSSGTGTPVAGIGTPIGGIGTPIAGIGTPHGISTCGPEALSGHRRASPPRLVWGPQAMAALLPVQFSHELLRWCSHARDRVFIELSWSVFRLAVCGIATPVGGIATPVGGIATPVGGIATPVGQHTPAGIATPAGGVSTPTGIPGGMAPTPVGGADTPGPVTMNLNPEQVETEGILTADIIRQQLKQHEEAAAKAKIAAGQKEVEQKKTVAAKPTKKRKEKTKFKF
ncbi:SF3B2 [Symbiodinium necroappetens]|uniref:SF3B2 protein n=1 Tax=Symbiodinium necroappetens TaxID=1628268 RepID=A0A812Z5Y7_9DINO|nr:SF3B2 [Symbiodinium necroappetens]